MANYYKIIILTLFVVFGSCETPEPEEIPSVNSDLSNIELNLINIWQYDSIVGDSNRRFIVANGQLEVGINRNGLGGNRADLFRRRIKYFNNKTYQLQWTERGEYDLGTENEPNCQPNFGFWHIEGDTLIHNSGMFYETKYHIQIEGKNLIRSSIRFMSGCETCYYLQGDVIPFIEYFQRVE